MARSLLAHSWEPGSVRLRPRVMRRFTSGRLLGVTAVVATALMLASGCAQAAGSAPGVGDTADPNSKHGDAVVLRVEYVGGFVTPSFLYSRLPVVSIYADGRVITEA